MRKGAILAVLASLAVQPGWASDAPLFSSDDILKAALTAPLHQAYGQKKQDQRLYLEGSWSYREGDNTVRLPVKIRTRGKSRRRDCVLPPLQLNFRKKELDGTVLAGQDKLKLVSPCRASDKYQQYIYLEFLVYRMYAMFREHHFDTRLVEVGYVDSEQKLDPWSSTNFLIEPEKAMAARSGLKPVKTTASKRSQMNLAETAFLEIFQYVIGNVDYSTLKAPAGSDCCHNIKLIAPKGAESGFIPVPYDFDSTGIVNASYATPPAQVPIKKVTERYFTGWCKEDRHYQAAVDELNAKRDEVFALFSDFPSLEKRYRKHALKYLEKSYKQINDEGYMKRYIVGRCRGEVIKG